jgi:arylsulfatase A-like enzyme
MQKNELFKAGTILTGLLGLTAIQAQKPAQPNLILIITDDQGYGDLGFTGNHHLKTPELDRFASQSISFTNFYVSPVSAPTRSSLMTGRYSLRTGVRDTYNGGAMMASSEVTIAEVLKAAGYATAHFGKWHLGDNYPMRPIDQGFDESLMHLGGGMGQPGDITTWYRGDSSYFDPVLWHNGKPEKFKGYCSDIFADAAIEFISNKSKEPFFCYLAFNAPHTPLQLPDKYYNMYKDIDPAEGFNDVMKPQMTDRDKEDARKVYGMVSNIDENVGKLLRKLEELKISDNTIVIFMTDNGPQQRRYVGGMRGLKSSVYRGGVRVPFFLRFPALGTRVKEVNVNAAHIDVLPTVAELCGLKLNDGIKRDGISLVPELTGKGKINNDRELFFYWTRHNPEKYNNIAVLKGNAKLAAFRDYNASLQDFEFYDLTKDPAESENLINERLSEAVMLKKSMDALLGDLIMSSNLIDPPYIIIGSEKENPVILNRNDASGQRAIWEQEEVYGLWRTDIREGIYSIRINFVKPVPGGGVMMLETGSIVYRAVISGTDVNSFVMDELALPGIKGDFIPFYEYKGRRIFPFSVEITRIR